MKTDPFHDRLLQIVLRLPGAYEDRPWGSVHCKVAGKIFVGWGRHDDGEMEIGFRVSPELQSMLVASDPRFKIAKYVGKYGGVDMRIGPKPNWDEVEQFIVESYRIIAPRKLVKELDAQRGEGSAGQAKEPAARQAAKRKAAKPAAERETAKPAAKRATVPKRAAPAKKTVRSS
ncbi:MAG TPA: MmcQ/YjbR family DNA-binding protein [Polyangiaceae bacterium]|jgi:predicted DNA-binding protein (MmcQ/YjbR family)|nr:MmcQ/YjbR family DNA-binding protein [Polyangiaceae bacterium]